MKAPKRLSHTLYVLTGLQKQSHEGEDTQEEEGESKYDAIR